MSLMRMMINEHSTHLQVVSEHKQLLMFFLDPTAAKGANSAVFVTVQKWKGAEGI